MSTERFARRLTAILAADVAGYSRLMGLDEAGTYARLKAAMRETVVPAVTELRGAVVKTAGDGVLAEFPSVVDALAAAMRIQAEMAERDPGVPAERRIRFRMGLNVGDIIVDGGDIYGDGVNIAARLEALAPPGGICVSRAVRDAAPGDLRVAFEDLGEQSVKNIPKPIRVYRVADAAALADTVPIADPPPADSPMAGASAADPDPPSAAPVAPPRPRPLTAEARRRPTAEPARAERHTRRGHGTARGEPQEEKRPRRSGLAPLWLLLLLLLGVGGVIAVKLPWNETVPLLGDGATDMPKPPQDQPLTPAARRLMSSDRPAVALMPFEAPGLDPARAWLPAGLQDAAIARLGRFASLAVIARESAAAFQGNPRDAAAVSQAFGVRWTANVALTTSGDSLTLTLRLADAAGNAAVDGERFTRPTAEASLLVDDVVRRIARQLAPSLADEEIAATLRQGQGGGKSGGAFLRDLEGRARLRAGDVSGAHALFDTAVALDADDAEAYRGIAESLFRAWLAPQAGELGTQYGRPEALAEALSVARLATETDPGSARAFAELAWLLAWSAESGDALAAAATARSLDASIADARLALVLLNGGRAEDAIAFLDRLVEVDPLHDARADVYRALAEVARGRLDEAGQILAACVAATPDEPLCPAVLSGVLTLAGKPEDGAAQARTVANRFAWFRLDSGDIPAFALLRDRPELAPLFAAMRRAGVPSAAAPAGPNSGPN